MRTNERAGDAAHAEGFDRDCWPEPSREEFVQKSAWPIWGANGIYYASAPHGVRATHGIRWRRPWSLCGRFKRFAAQLHPSWRPEQ